LARHRAVLGFDVDEQRVAELREGRDRTREVEPDALVASSLTVTADPTECAGADIYIVTVPTPIDADNNPDLAPVAVGIASDRWMD
jgi:UDP-N-acetyl-D-galactosamine dehydrogenase